MEDFRSEDLRSEIYPQSGTDAEDTAVEIVAVRIDRAAAVDTSGEVRIIAGRP